MGDWTIREAAAGDYRIWRDIYAEVAAEGRWIGGETAPPDEVMLPRFQADIEDPDRLVIVADVEETGIVGGLYADFARRGVAHLGMQIVEEWRGRGLGGELMSRCIEWCRSKGAHKVTLEVWPHNSRAIALYQRFGFAVEGRLRRHYRRRSGELWDAVVMGLVLDESSPGSSHPDAVPQ